MPEKEYGLAYKDLKEWKWRCRDSNPGLCEYESHALPTELHRLFSEKVV